MSDYQGGFHKKDKNFELIVVLFVLLIIVGVSFKKDFC
ncbi:MAG: YjcZ family sporulation protein [Bacillota bacterium]